MIKRNIYKNISKITLSAILLLGLSAPFSSMAYAKDGDIWNKDNNLGSIGDILLKNKPELFKLLRNISSYDYEISGKIYNTKEVNDEFSKMSNSSIENVHASIKEKFISTAKDLPTSSNPEDNSAIVFKCKVLEDSIRYEINKPTGTIYKKDVQDITKVSIQGYDIFEDHITEHVTDLSGIEHLTKLQVLDLDGHDIVNISPLANLTKLKKLFLSTNQITDIGPLKELTNLEQLSLYDNDISDISSLKGLINLKYLYLHGNDISKNDINELKKILKNCDVDA